MTTCYNTGLGSFQKWHIGNDIREILLADADVHEKVGENIYPLVAPENVAGEFLVYNRAKYSKETVKMGVWSDDCQLVITAVSDDYDSALDLAAAIDNALVGQHTNSDGMKFTVELVDSSEEFSDLKYIETLLLRIK